MRPGRKALGCSKTAQRPFPHVQSVRPPLSAHFPDPVARHFVGLWRLRRRLLGSLSRTADRRALTRHLRQVAGLEAERSGTRR
jgi:hypothetical protein